VAYEMPRVRTAMVVAQDAQEAQALLERALRQVGVAVVDVREVGVVADAVESGVVDDGQ
jgi:hypothetical protein